MSMADDYDYDIRVVGVCKKCGLEQEDKIAMPCPRCGGWVEKERS